MTTRRGFAFRGALLGATIGALAFGAGVPQRVHASVDKTYEQLKILIDILDYIKEDYVEDV